MAIIWNKLIPRWGGLTIEPPEAKKDTGYIAGDKPPAKWENWLRKGTYEALDETRDVIEGIDSQLTQKPSMTTAPITLYVSSSGNDSNNGLTPATALRNIQTAIGKIPQIVNHEINIILANGIYDESILLYGFIGKGAILLKGGTILSNDYVIHQASSYNNVCTVVMTGINAKITTDVGFAIQRSLRTNLYHCAVPLSSEHDGVFIADGSRSLIENCRFENRGRAIHCNNSILLSKDNAGLLNQVGLLAISSTIMKEGTQPTGTTNEITTAGGVIR